MCKGKCPNTFSHLVYRYIKTERITKQGQCSLIYTDFNIFIYRWTADIFICWCISDAFFFSNRVFFCCFLSISFQTCDRLCYTWRCFLSLFCLVKNKHPNIIEEAQTIFPMKYGQQTGEMSRGGDRRGRLSAGVWDRMVVKEEMWHEKRFGYCMST